MLNAKNTSVGFFVLHSMLEGGSFNILKEPDPANIANDVGTFVTAFSPGQYLVPGGLIWHRRGRLDSGCPRFRCEFFCFMRLRVMAYYVLLCHVSIPNVKVGVCGWPNASASRRPRPPESSLSFCIASGSTVPSSGGARRKHDLLTSDQS